MSAPSGGVHLALPRWIHVPGRTWGADHETLAMALALVPARFEGFVPARHGALRYGIGLNDAGYFWESHEILEAVWAAAPQRGRERILLRACIQIANANLKLRMAKPHAAQRLFAEALTELRELGVRQASAGGSGFADSFPVLLLTARVEERLARPSLGEPDWLTIADSSRS
jgi:hypothetical protein